jgi:hypothetical protein
LAAKTSETIMDNYASHRLESSNTADDIAEDLATLLPAIPFPYKLRQMLDNSAKDERMEAIVSWLPNNQSFKVHDKDAFVKEVLPRYFFKITKYKSFIRQLNSYGFESLTLRGGYFHEHFIRGKPRYCKYIIRTDNRPRVGVKKGNLGMIPEVVVCYNVEANNAVQAPAAAADAAALSNKENTIDSLDHDGDRVMFHGKHFCFVDAIVGEYYLPHHHVGGLAPHYDFANPQERALLPTKKYQRFDKEFVRQNPPPFYKPRTPTEARLLLNKILGDL